MAAERALEILSCLDAHGIVVWLDGGWGVDAHLGKQTRAHDDLDVIVEIDQVLRLEAVLNHLGYVRKDDRIQVDVERDRVPKHRVFFSDELTEKLIEVRIAMSVLVDHQTPRFDALLTGFETSRTIIVRYISTDHIRKAGVTPEQARPST